MSIVEAIILGIVQGLTEFIPVSSSGHLILLHDAFGIEEGGLLFDVALHIGTLAALVLFFHQDIRQLFEAFFRKGRKTTHLARIVVLATIPAVIVGVLLQAAAESTFRSSKLVALNLILFGIIMLLAEHYAKKRANKTGLEKIHNNQALIVGLAQAGAIIPGVSRSGSTITAGLFMGLDRVAATRFSFLLAIPITFGAILKVVLSDDALSRINGDMDVFLIGIATAFLSGLFAIRFLLRYLAKHTLAAFAYYRFIVGAVVLAILLL